MLLSYTLVLEPLLGDFIVEAHQRVFEAKK
jgi:hypothetical protein